VEKEKKTESENEEHDTRKVYLTKRIPFFSCVLPSHPPSLSSLQHKHHEKKKVYLMQETEREQEG
jgi:hypothetical protein